MSSTSKEYSILCVLPDNALTCLRSYTDDKNRDNIDPDKLKNGITNYPSPEDKEILYMFFARYVRKAHSHGAIKSELRNNEGLSFIDIISLSNIAFVISVIKNGWDVWDQKIRMKGSSTWQAGGKSKAIIY